MRFPTAASTKCPKPHLFREPPVVSRTAETRGTSIAHPWCAMVSHWTFHRILHGAPRTILYAMRCSMGYVRTLCPVGVHHGEMLYLGHLVIDRCKINPPQIPRNSAKSTPKRNACVILTQRKARRFLATSRNRDVFVSCQEDNENINIVNLLLSPTPCPI